MKKNKKINRKIEYKKIEDNITKATKNINVNNNVVSQFIDRKEFTYTNKECNLSFKLRIDNSSELRHFKAILLQAIEDIDKILEPMKN